ncbi:ABC transporter substrate-binding protein [Nocardia brasiliensis]|uniref:ABC transporter substrate-binding protein n=1 Tax=Nocardia brasiliensis TaxID=37326 RepID=UPI0024583D10|nr:ABC transporter substrate-binding protein [Nocardia brasiliensis]
MIAKRILSAAIPVLVLVAAGCGGRTAEPVASAGKVTVAHVPSTLFAPLYVAAGKKYFAEEGLTVELQAMKAGQDAIPLAAAGKVDVVVAGFSAGLFNAVHSGLRLKVVGSMGIAPGDPKASPSALEVSRKLVEAGEVTSVAELRGRRVAVSGGAAAAGGYQLAAILRQSGLALRDVQIVNIPIPDQRTALANGGVDAALTAAPFTTRIEQAGIAVPLAVPAAGVSATGVVYGGAFTESPAAHAFFRALQRASRDLQDGGVKSPENLAILAQATGQDRAVLEATPAYRWRPDLSPDAEQLTAQQQAYRDAGLLDYADVIAADTYVSTAFSGE